MRDLIWKLVKKIPLCSYNIFFSLFKRFLQTQRATFLNVSLISKHGPQPDTHHLLVLHAPGLPDLVLAGVQVQPLVLQHLPLPHDVLHLTIKKPLKRSNESLISSPDVFLFYNSEPEKITNL